SSLHRGDGIRAKMEPARHLRAVAGRARTSDRVAEAGGRSRRRNAPRDEGLVDELLGFVLSSVSLLAPGIVAALEGEVEAKLERIPTQLNEYGYDPWGMSPRTLHHTVVLLALMYRYYFRVEVEGVENFPSGRMLLIANHAGQLPLDAAMLMCASVLEADPPRVLRGMAEYWMATLPFIGTIGHRIGSVVGTPKNCMHLLRREEAVI